MTFRISSARRALSILLLAAAATSAAPSSTPPLLEAAVEHWIAAKSEWALTQRTRTFNGDGTVKEDRVERYDPSQPDNQRWHLISINGADPTPQQREHWEHRRNSKPRKHTEKSPREYLDFEHAILDHQTATECRYAVALRPEAARLIDVDKLDVEISVDRKTQTIERVNAGLSEPVRVAFGLARIIEIALDVRFDLDEPPKDDAPPDGGKATGTGHATLTKFGDRAEYDWSDFTRVTAYHASGKPAAP